MIRAHTIARVSFTTCFLATIAACQPGAPVPVNREPRHHVAYENSLVRVLDVRVPPGDTTLYHVHAERYLGVVINGSKGWEQFLGKEPSATRSTTGAILDNTSLPLPYTHRVGNADTTAFHYIVGQQLARSAVAADRLPEKANMRMERETPLAWVYRVTLAPGERTASHQHAMPGLTIQISPGTVEFIGTAAVAASKEKGAGAWWWRGTGHDHAFVNGGTTTIELIEIDWK